MSDTQKTRIIKVPKAAKYIAGEYDLPDLIDFHSDNDLPVVTTDSDSDITPEEIYITKNNHEEVYDDISSSKTNKEYNTEYNTESFNKDLRKLMISRNNPDIYIGKIETPIPDSIPINLVKSIPLQKTARGMIKIKKS
jgi:hypothetical protein